MPFEKIIPAVARGEVGAGLVIHEGQILFEQAGLRLLMDVGEWWKRTTGLPLPLGANAIRELWNDVAQTQANIEFDAERVWVVAQTVLTSWHAAYTYRRTAERYRIRGFSTFELDESGLIQRQRQWAQFRVVGTDSTFKPEGEA